MLVKMYKTNIKYIKFKEQKKSIFMHNENKNIQITILQIKSKSLFAI